MAVSLSLSIKQNSQNQSNKTSNVTVSMTIKWTGGVYNKKLHTATLKIDGKSYTTMTTFNPKHSATGSQTLFTKTVDIKHGSDGKKTLSCSASYITGFDGKDYTITASGSKTLTTIASTSPSKPGTPTPVNAPTITKMDLQSQSDRTVFVAWSWSKEHTKHYIVHWYYSTGDGVWFDGSKSEITLKNSTYSAPSNATKVKVNIKPVSTTKIVKTTDPKTKKTKETETVYWTANVASKEYVFTWKDQPLGVPDIPTVTITATKLTAEIENVRISTGDSINTTRIQFEVNQDGVSTYKREIVEVVKNRVSFSCTVQTGHTYRVRARAVRGDEYGQWSDYSSSVMTKPASPSHFDECKATSATSVYLEWPAVSNATSYDIRYTNEYKYFDEGVSSDEITVINDIKTTKYEKTGLESGKEYFFQVRAVNASGESAWSAADSVIIGKAPAPPTTWSNVTTAMIGESIILNWAHNSEDGSDQTFAVVEIEVNGDLNTHVVEGTTQQYEIQTSSYQEGATIRWRVKTAGILKTVANTPAYGDWSIQRSIDVYAPPSLHFKITDLLGDDVDVINEFPFYMSGQAGPATQHPIGYYLTVISNEAYDTVDKTGSTKIISEGDEIYSEYFNINNDLLVEMLPSNIDLENGIKYTATCTVAMDSGLSAESSIDFWVYWDEEKAIPDAEIGVDMNAVTAIIRPYCETREVKYYKAVYDSSSGSYIESTELIPESTLNRIQEENIDPVEYGYTTTYKMVYQAVFSDGTSVTFWVWEAEEGTPVEGITLSVYRREFDGNFVEIASGIDNNYTYVTDPHPPLDYARYRIVATSDTTGAIGFYDTPAYPVQEVGVIIQWDEEWSEFYYNGEDVSSKPEWSGSLLRLPYNIDVSDSRDFDVTLVEYIGRKHPVSYYGTQLGETATWSLMIPKEDKETLHSLRRLSIWMGDVYVREPSGSGYWANVSVSFSQKHTEVIIPVTLNIKRVEGGI